MGILSKIRARTLDMFRGHPFHSFRFVVGSIVVGFSEILSLGALLPIINHILDSETESNYVIQIFNKVCLFLGLDFNLASYLMIFVATSFLSVILYLIIQYDKGLLMKELEYHLKTTFFHKVIYSKWSKISRLQDGKFINSLTRELDTCRRTDEYILFSISQIILVFFSTFFLFSINASATLTFFGTTCFVYIFIFPIIKWGNSLAKIFTNHNSTYTQNMIDVMNSLKNIKSMSLENSLEKKVEPSFYNVTKYNFIMNSIFSPFRNRTIEWLGMIILCILIYISLDILKVPSAELLLMIAVLLKLIPTLSQLYNTLSIISCGMVAFEYIEGIVKSCEEENFVSENNEELGELNELSIKNLSYGYEPDAMLFNNLNVKFKKGEFWAVCGKTGAGKSTLLDIISKLIEPSENHLYYNDIPYSKINNISLHKKIGYLTQNHFIFEGTLLENITWGMDDYSEKNLSRAIRIAQLTQLVDDKGLDYPILSGGKNLSGGQNQRIGIARVLIRDYDFILLDEPTSALDQATELNFFKEMSLIKKDICLILITHKEEFLNHVDFVLEHKGDGYSVRKSKK